MSTIALDLGSTRIKAARIDADGRTLEFAQRDVPAVAGTGLRREFDPKEWLERTLAALFELAPRDGETLGIASQRSSFLLFNARDGSPVTPVISWQDRRAAEWIANHLDAQEWISEITGLPLSAHYVGPKLAAMFAADSELAGRAHSGELRLGTLETWLAWKCSAAGLLATDETMAARTLLFDPQVGAWSPRLCDFFGVPRALLPRVLPSSGRSDPFGNLLLTASIADQSAGALHAVGTSPEGVLINFGTGTFVLAPNSSKWVRRPGYLTGLLLSRGPISAAPTRSYAMEGTVNAGASLIVKTSASEIAPQAAPEDAWALVDENGIGAPHWRAELGPIWSPAAANLDAAARRRVGELGLCFRVREILRDLLCEDRRWVVAGGALHDAAFAQRLADALGRSIEVCLEPEATLTGVAGLASGEVFAHGRALTRIVTPGSGREQVDARFEGWRRWVRNSLER